MSLIQYHPFYLGMIQFDLIRPRVKWMKKVIDSKTSNISKNIFLPVQTFGRFTLVLILKH